MDRAYQSPKQRVRPGKPGPGAVTLLLSGILLTTALPAVPLSAQSSSGPGAQRMLAPHEYGKFEVLLSARVLSPDGRWLAYRINRVDGHEELRVREVAAGDVARAVPWGSDPTFSADGRWLSWSVEPSREVRHARADGDPPLRNGAALLDLESGAERSFTEVRGRALDPSGRFLALHGYAPEEPRGKGADLRVLDLHLGGETTLGNVDAYAWSETGSLLAVTITSGSEEGAGANGVQLLDPAAGRFRTLDSSPSAYRAPSWSRSGADLAVLRSVAPAGADSLPHDVLAWRGLEERWDTALEPFVLPARPPGAATGLGIVGLRDPEWSERGARVGVGLKPVPEAAEEWIPEQDDTPGQGTGTQRNGVDAGKEPELPSVQLWHTRDVRIVPMQQARGSADARRTLLAAWGPESGHLVQVGTDLLAEARLTRDDAWGIERRWTPHPWGFMFGRPYHDVEAVDVRSGERRLVAERVRYSWDDPGSRYVLVFDGTDYQSLEIATGETRNLTRGLEATFANLEYDTPTDLLPPHGMGGWMDDGSTVLLYDRYDVWRVALDGSGGRRVTRGAEEALIHRAVQLDSEAPAFSSGDDLYLSLRGEWTEQRGYARVSPDGEVERLVLKDRLVSQLGRADSAEVFVFREESRVQSPDWYVAGPDLAAPVRVTDTNPFQGEYAWTRAELLDFESEAGERLQGVLLYPADHDPARVYPMIVYTYEMLSQQLHSYQAPSERSYYNFTAWTQHGYFVLLPDIRYRARDPGVSALEAVRPAIGVVTGRGLVDPERVGLIGHSWGGYQATYLPTRTDLFAASVAGAPLTDFVSFMGQIHWNSGGPEVDHWETGQGRMDVPYWEDPDAHHRNSPLHAVHDMETPLLMAFGDQDGVVEWWQGTVFYNYARRAERQMVLLVYEGEDHGFQEEANQVDYHRRILEWFGHYLKGDPAPRWITEGVPLNAMDEEKRRVAGGQP